VAINISEKSIFYPEDGGRKVIPEDSNLECDLFEEGPSTLKIILGSADFILIVNRLDLLRTVDPN
jgi:hypothetical protein